MAFLLLLCAASVFCNCKWRVWDLGGVESKHVFIFYPTPFLYSLFFVHVLLCLLSFLRVMGRDRCIFLLFIAII
jgi:hypothetical protein